ncbi:hypothetical protein R1flu_004039 [Riccia fluitans]|uniref:Uncharacterized protein n=1 Tax=Riccia fluitans TaxID=41844 RepID=A0ABD1YPZ2_9MARC
MNRLQSLEFSSGALTEQGLLEMAMILETGDHPSLQRLICTGACNTVATSTGIDQGLHEECFEEART